MPQASIILNQIYLHTHLCHDHGERAITTGVIETSLHLWFLLSSRGKKMQSKTGEICLLADCLFSFLMNQENHIYVGPAFAF